MELASYIDHTMLRADSTLDNIRKICTEAHQFQFPVVCVPPFYVKNAKDILREENEESAVKVATVIGFPMGYSTTAAKVEEIKRAIDDGASEVDVVINICAVKSGLWNYVQNDIDSTATAAHLKGKKVKTILETGLLSEAELLKLLEICNEVKPDFVKTSTGFNGDGATVQVVQLLKAHLENPIKIKASGGIRTREDALRLIGAGAQRIGSSSSVMIVQS
jgi:deoxyribose-phosphate aldolase